jgi:hypothetical protein
VAIYDLDDRVWTFEVDLGLGAPARLSGHPDTWEPADPGYMDILEVSVEGRSKPVREERLAKVATVVFGKPWDAVLDEVAEQAREEVIDRYEDALICAAEDRYEQMRDRDDW